jgi:hypothetical protein
MWCNAMIQALTYANTNLIPDTSVAMELEIWFKSPALDPVYTYFVIILHLLGFQSTIPCIFIQLEKKFF